jgi:TRAP-type C4-dicarboxylate transport system permease small subunit
MQQALLALDNVVDKLLRWSVIGCVAGCLFFLAIGVIGRFFNFNISSYPEFIEILFAWSTFLGAALLWRERALLRVDFVQHMLPAGPSWVLKVVIEIGMLIFAALMMYYGWDFATSIKEYTPFLQADRVYWYLSIPVSAAIMAGYSVAALYELLTHPLREETAESKQQEIL